MLCDAVDVKSLNQQKLLKVVSPERPGPALFFPHSSLAKRHLKVLPR